MGNYVQKCITYIFISQINLFYYISTLSITLCRFLNSSMPLHEIRICLLYEFKLGHSAAEATRNISQAWSEDAVSERDARWWFERFRSGNMSIEDMPRSGRPSKVNISTLQELIEADPRQTSRELAEALHVDHQTVLNHLHENGMVWKLEKWIPHKLSESNKLQRFSICSSLLLQHENDPFLSRIITCDEKWLWYDCSARSGQWVKKDKPPGKVAKRDIHSKKLMVSVWWSKAGIIHYEFLKPGQTIDSENYCHQLDVVHAKLLEIQPALVNRKVPLVLHDNARPHVSKRTLQKLKQLGYETLPHPAYSPDISPTDYHIFRCLSNFLRGKTFIEEKDVKQAFTDFLTSCDSDFYTSGIQKLVERWEKVVESEGDYFDE